MFVPADPTRPPTPHPPPPPAQNCKLFKSQPLSSLSLLCPEDARTRRTVTSSGNLRTGSGLGLCMQIPDWGKQVRAVLVESARANRFQALRHGPTCNGAYGPSGTKYVTRPHNICEAMGVGGISRLAAWMAGAVRRQRADLAQLCCSAAMTSVMGQLLDFCAALCGRVAHVSSLVSPKGRAFLLLWLLGRFEIH